VSQPLRATGLSRAFGDEPAVTGVDLDVGTGEIHALVGLNGAGKTTLMRMLLAMVKPDSGEAMILGSDVGAANASIWGQVGHMIETPFAYPELTVTENVMAAARLHGVESRTMAGVVSDAIDRFELGHWATRRARTLSLGNRQRLGLVCSLVHRPKIIILDEPSNALDPAGVVFMRDLLRNEAEERGASILLSSHHLDELARVADRISVIHRGRIIGGIDPNGIDIERTFFDLVLAADEASGSERRA
jgi:ABC-2 type transport system ATP-binding protein